MADEDTETQVSAAEIARLAGVGRAAVSNWRRRFDSFPDPVGGSTTSPSFDLMAVERWLRDNGKLREMDAVDRLWHSLETTRSGEDIATGLAHIGIALRAASLGVPAEGTAERIRSALPDDLARGVGDDEWPAVLRLRSAVGDVDDPATLFEQLYQRFIQAMSRQVPVTTEPLARLMIDVLEPVEGTLVDPACGAGSTLRTALVRHPDLHVVGQEIDDNAARIAAVRLSFVPASGRAPDMRGDDSLLADAWPDLLADAAVCHPPFAEREWGRDDLEYDARWEYGLPPRGESELAWVQHVLAHVRPGGRAVVLLPPGVGTRRTGRRIRAELLRRGALRAVIALPPGAASPLGIPLVLWILRRPDGTDNAAGVVFHDASGHRGRRDGRIDWSDLSEGAVTALREYAEGAEPSSDRTAIVPVVDLLDDDVDLSPSLRVRPAATQVDVDAVRACRDEVHDRLSWLVGALPEVAEVAGAGPPTGATVSIGDLVRSGAIQLYQHSGRVDEGDGHGTVPVLSGRDVVTGSAPSRHVSESSAAAMHELRGGDVVVAAIADRIRTRVIEEDGVVMGPTVHALRPDPAVVDAWFLAGCLRTSANARFGSMLAGMQRVDIRRCEVPRVPLSEQQAYGDAFRRLAEVEAALGDVSRAGNDLVAMVTDGLASGTLRVTS